MSSCKLRRLSVKVFATNCLLLWTLAVRQLHMSPDGMLIIFSDHCDLPSAGFNGMQASPTSDLSNDSRIIKSMPYAVPTSEWRLSTVRRRHPRRPESSRISNVATL